MAVSPIYEFNIPVLTYCRVKKHTHDCIFTPFPQRNVMPRIYEICVYVCVRACVYVLGHFMASSIKWW